MTDTPQAAPVRANDWKALVENGVRSIRRDISNNWAQGLDATEAQIEIWATVLDAVIDQLTAAENDRTSGRVEVTDAMVDAGRRAYKDFVNTPEFRWRPDQPMWERMVPHIIEAALSHAAVTVAGGEICHCTCHNDPVYCKECKECDCHVA